MAKAADTEAERVRKWWGRFDATDLIYREQRVFWDRLEDALSGTFPALIPTAEGDVDGRIRLRHSDQIDLNLLLRAKRIFEATAYDEFPSLRFSREPEMDEEAVCAAEKLIEKLMDDAGAIAEAKTGMSYSMTRGSSIVWIDVERAQIPPPELAAKNIPPSAFVEAAMAGQQFKLPVGADYQAIFTAASAVLNTPEMALGLSTQQEGALQKLALDAQKAYEEQLSGVHSLDRRAKIKFEATPYGSWCRFDASVTDRRRMGHLFRKMVMTPADFEAEPLFKPEVKKKVLEQYREGMEALDGQVPGKAKPSQKYPILDEIDRIVVWCIYDKVNWKRHYLCSLVKDEFLETNDEPPYLNENGQPIFPDYWPCVIRTPLEHNKEVAWKILGVPLLEPGWANQIEFIKARSAWIIACKKSGRFFTAANGVSDTALNLISRGVDGTIVKPGANYNAATEGDILKPIVFGQAPVDYLLASKQCLADFCNAIGISLGAMTGEPVADTLGQEQLAMAGSNITQMDMVRCFESGFAEMAQKAFLLFKANANDAEWASYLGVAATQPRMGPSGPQASLIDTIKAAGLDGCKLTCRFASSTRAEDAVSIKQAQDFLAQNQLVLEPRTQQPYFDPRPILQRIAKMQDIQGLVPNPAINIILQMQMQQAAMGGPPGGDGDGADSENKKDVQSDSRKAGGQRGTPNVPGRQSRDQGPMTNGHAAAAAHRPMTATS